VLLQAGQLLSNIGTQSTTIAYPLLVLALTHSPSRAGVVSFARAVPQALFALPAGLAADRFPRKRLMIVADVARASAVGSLAAVILLQDLRYWMIPLVAFVEGTGSALFSAANAGALRAVVPRRQLPAAISVITGRGATVQLAGPPLGGALFGIARAVPFVADAASYAFSSASLVAMRTPFEELRQPETAPLRVQLLEGIRFLWTRPFLRTVALLFALANFIGPGVLPALVVIGEQQGLTSGEVGALVATFGACLLVGSFLSSLVRRLLPVRAVIVLEMWSWAGCALFLVWPSVYVLAASILPTALAIPSTNSVANAYRIAMTPDRLLGRSESVRSMISLVIAPLGPLAAGFMLADVSARGAIALFAAFGLALAVWGTLSPAIRAAPALSEI
jgi:MFS family permease